MENSHSFQWGLVGDAQWDMQAEEFVHAAVPPLNQLQTNHNDYKLKDSHLKLHSLTEWR